MKKLILQWKVLIIFMTAQFFFLVYMFSQDGNKTVFFPKMKVPRLVISLSTFSTRIKLSALKTVMHLHKEQNVDRIIVNVALKHRSIDKNKTSCKVFGDCVEVFGISEPVTAEEILGYFEKYFGVFHKVTCYFNKIKRQCYEKDEIFLQFFLDFDWGPSSKLLGALLVEEDPDTVIVTMDDDCHYYPNLARQLAERLPENGVMGAGDAWQNVALCRKSFMSRVYNEQKSLMFRLRIASVLADYDNYGIELQNSWLMGVAAIAYRVKYFSDDIFDEASNLSPQCFINDDVWIGGFLKRKKMQYYIDFTRSIYYHQRHPTASVSVIPHAQDYDLLSCALSYGFT